VWADLIKMNAATSATNDAKFRVVFFASQGDALEPFELADSLLDAGSAAIERLGEDFRNMFGV
jgi:hypothetical protein